MKRKTAGLIFLGICFVLALLLVTGTIAPLVGGVFFAVALVIFGGLSRGFTKADE